MNFIETAIYGLSLGSIYALIALGYIMVYGIAKMLNFAHGDIIMVGAYSVVVMLGLTGGTGWWQILVSAAVAVLVCTLLGVLTEKIAYKPLRGASPLAVLITAIGVSYLLQSLSQIIFGSDGKTVNVTNFKPLAFGGFTIKVEAIITLVVTAVIMVCLTLFIKHTKIGKAMLAVSEDKGAAQLMGVNVNKTISLTFAIGSALAAVAGLFYLMQIPVVNPTTGSMPGIKAFVAAVLGGIGSIPGAMVGGIILGLIEKFAMSSPLASYADAIVFGILIVILLIKPTGLFGKKRIEKV